MFREGGRVSCEHCHQMWAQIYRLPRPFPLIRYEEKWKYIKIYENKIWVTYLMPFHCYQLFTLFNAIDHHMAVCLPSFPNNSISWMTPSWYHSLRFLCKKTCNKTRKRYEAVQKMWGFPTLVAALSVLKQNAVVLVNGKSCPIVRDEKIYLPGRSTLSRVRRPCELRIGSSWCVFSTETNACNKWPVWQNPTSFVNSSSIGQLIIHLNPSTYPMRSLVSVFLVGQGLFTAYICLVPDR